MKKFKSLLIAVVALATASMFTSCAAAAAAVVAAVAGDTQTIKVTSSVSNFKTAYFYAVEMVDDGNGGYTEGSKKYDLTFKVNGDSVKISDKLETLHAYTIYFNSVHNASDNAVYTYGGLNYTDRPKVTKSSASEATLSVKGADNDIFIIAGNIDYEIVLSVDSVNDKVVAKLKGTRQASK